jgi:RepB DNA-primase from phage plasmid/CHC2 zinc finger
VQRQALQAFLRLLFADAPSSAFIEVRLATPDGMTRRFVRAAQPLAAARTVEAFTPVSEVYVGVLPRARRAGKQGDLLPDHRLLWVDCDRPDAVAVLSAFAVAPTLVVRSGTPGYLHAYWLLRSPMPVLEIERLNRQLALALGGDLHTTDAPRVMRPPGAFNHKTTPPRPAVLAAFRPDHVYSRGELLNALPTQLQPSIAQPSSSPSWIVGHPRDRGADPLLQLDPAFYVERLTDRIVPRSRKVLCPLHVETSPSFHVYPDPKRGWFCFGCHRGGSVYDLAAGLWHRPTHGPTFRALRAELEHLLL